MQSAWLQAKVMVFVVINLAAVLFLLARRDGKQRMRM
jgi:hypothetical protein